MVCDESLMEVHVGRVLRTIQGEEVTTQRDEADFLVYRIEKVDGTYTTRYWLRKDSAILASQDRLTLIHLYTKGESLSIRPLPYEFTIVRHTQRSNFVKMSFGWRKEQPAVGRLPHFFDLQTGG